MDRLAHPAFIYLNFIILHDIRMMIYFPLLIQSLLVCIILDIICKIYLRPAHKRGLHASQSGFHIHLISG